MCRKISIKMLDRCGIWEKVKHVGWMWHIGVCFYIILSTTIQMFTGWHFLSDYYFCSEHLYVFQHFQVSNCRGNSQAEATLINGLGRMRHVLLVKYCHWSTVSLKKKLYSSFPREKLDRIASLVVIRSTIPMVWVNLV